MNSTNLILIVLISLIAAGAAYQAGVSNYQKELEDKLEKIETLEKSIEDFRASPTPPPTPKPTPVVGPISGGEINCFLCHGLEQTKSFHLPQTLMRIAESDGKRRRVCIDCHGPNGPPWSPDEQMTDFELIDFDSSVGVNGMFILSNKVVHSIHKRKLDAGVLKCEFCHVPPGTTNFIKPRVKTELGRILYCQNEGCHDSEGGNYITIHLELRPFNCTTCHTGEIVRIHQEKTKGLGQISQ
jgi:hypothetical protein